MQAGGEIRKREEFHLFGGRGEVGGEGGGGQGRNLNVWGGEENFPSKGLTGYGMYS